MCSECEQKANPNAWKLGLVKGLKSKKPSIPPPAWIEAMGLHLVDKDVGIYKRKVDAGWGSEYEVEGFLEPTWTGRQWSWQLMELDSDGGIYFEPTSCCGVSEIPDGAMASPKVLEYIIKKGFRKDQGGCIIATSTDADQGQLIYAKTLEKSGFKKVATFLNPRTSNTITLWYLLINQKEKKK